VIDPRFYQRGEPLSASDIANVLGAPVVRGDPQRRVTEVAALANAGLDDLCFLDDAAGAGTDLSRAGILLVARGAAANLPDGPAIIETSNPRAAFARLAERLIAVRSLEPGQPAIHPTSRIHASARLEPGVIVGPDAAIGAGAQIGANTVIGPGVQIGSRTIIGSNATVRCALIGDGVRIYPGVVIGEAGFGLAAGAAGANLTPHFGRVIIQNGVSIGANSCIDRGLLEDTVIGEGTHIDNLCHIGHNCRIGAHVVMAAFAGVSGSSTVGDGVQFGGRVGLKDHVTIGSGARIAAGAAVLNDVPGGETWAGYPAKPIRSWMRELAWLARSAQKRPTRND
jgi:UDP-3-O-[3-hydroxymyristoyl] glucosamine N-acyltransferase